MKIVCAGTDPAGLYLAILLKTRHPQMDVSIADTGEPAREGAPPHILTNPVKPELRLADEALQREIMAAATTTRGILIRRDAETVQSDGQTYTMVGAEALASIARRRAQKLGIPIVTSPAQTASADVVVIADGAESRMRTAMADGFKTTLQAGSTRFMVFETSHPVDKPSFLFRRTTAGVFHAYLYPETGGVSPLVVEAPHAALTAAGIEAASPEQAAAFCRVVFSAEIGDAELRPKTDGWRPYRQVRNATWTSGNAVLLGAAAYNAHFSVGLGVRSGLEDAEALATLLDGKSRLADTLARFEAARKPRAESLLRASRASQTWFEHTSRYVDMPLEQFAYSCLTRTMRLAHESLRALAPDLAERVEQLIAGPAVSNANRPLPPMFTPITLRGLAIPNRIVMSPMCMYNAEDGSVGDFHLVHYGSRAMGGTGLVITEMTDVSPEGRISAHCAGIYKPEHVAAWRRVTEFVHAKTSAKIGIQLGHAGRKGAESRPWERAQHKGAAWQTIAPSPIPFAAEYPAPREMTRADMDRLITAYGNAARMAHEAGFDLVELHFAHGYLLSTFISPLANKRADQYGGPLTNRLRFPMEVFESVRANWPDDKPISVRISATDWMEGGTTTEDAIEIGRTLKAAGNDILCVSTGGVTGTRPASGRLYQATFSDQIRNELKIRTMTVGGITSHADINTVIAAGRADMCALARGHLFDPYFARHAAYQQGYPDLPWPSEYNRAASITMQDF
ncbi:MAG: FAD-dependent monooxygenase [Hyphomicrobiaceae bacterium]